MSVRFRIFCPIYLSPNESLIKACKYFLNRLLCEIDARISSLYVVNSRFLEVELVGSEASIASNYLKKIFGMPISLDDIQVGSKYPGRIVDIRGDTLYVDIGIATGEKVEILKSVFVMQMLNVRRYSGDINELFKYMGIGPFFPLVVVIRKIENSVLGLPAQQSKLMFKRWLDQRLDRIYVWGALRSHLDKALRASGEYKNIVKIERLGLLEYHVVCRFGIFGDELANKLYRLGIKNFVVFMPRKLRKLIRSFGR